MDRLDGSSDHLGRNETTQLLGNEKPGYNYGGDSSASNTNSPRSRLVLIEFVAALLTLATVLQLQTSQFYIYERISENKHFNSSTTNVCEKAFKNSTSAKTENEIQKESSTMLMALIFATSFPAILPTLYFGTLTGRYGRKLAVRCALIGFLLKNVVHFVIYYWKFSIYYMIIGNAIEGILGAYGAAVLGIFGIVADVTTVNHARSFRMTTVTAAMNVAAALGNGISGVLIDAVGYVIITIIIIGLSVINLFYVECFLPETIRRSIEKVTFFQSFKQSFSFYFKDTKDKRRFKLILCFLSFFLLIGFMLVNMTTLTLFLLNKPFCWSKIHITVFGALRQLTNWVVILCFARFLRNVVSDVGMALAACASCIAAQMITAFADVNGLMYGAAAIGVITELSSPMVRSIMSKLVTAEEQGPLFAGLAVAEVICVAIFSTVSTMTYRQTVALFPGTVFLLVAGVTFLVAIFLLILMFRTRKETAECGLNITFDVPQIAENHESQDNVNSRHQQ